jgi:hypothetical protein
VQSETIAETARPSSAKADLVKAALNLAIAIDEGVSSRPREKRQMKRDNDAWPVMSWLHSRIKMRQIVCSRCLDGIRSKAQTAARSLTRVRRDGRRREHPAAFTRRCGSSRKPRVHIKVDWLILSCSVENLPAAMPTVDIESCDRIL